MEGRGSPKLNYNKYDAAHNTRGALNLQKIVWEIGLQTSEKKTNCDKNDCGVIITLPLASCVPELEMAMKKISRRNRVRRNAENRRRYACATVRNAPALQPVLTLSRMLGAPGSVHLYFCASLGIARSPTCHVHPFQNAISSPPATMSPPPV